MISFKQFLESQQKFSVEQIKLDCKDYFNLVKGSSKKILYHGQQGEMRDIFLRKWSERIVPRDSSLLLHATVNELMKDEFGVEARNWFFAISNANTAQIYTGSSRKIPYAVFPTGRLQWLCNTDEDDGHDLTGTVDHYAFATRKTNPEMSLDDRRELAIEKYAEKFLEFPWEFNTNFAKCMESGNEIMIKCDKIYFVDPSSEIFKELKAYMNTQ